MNRRDRGVLQKILKYCGQIGETHQIFHEDKSLFYDSERGFAYRNAIAMPILQIGELAKTLSPEMRQAHPDIPWRKIVGMRDVVVHHYGSLDFDIAWSVSQNDVPVLAEKVRLILTESESPFEQHED